MPVLKMIPIAAETWL